MNQYEEICKDMGQRAKVASFELAQIDQGTLDSALLAIADAVEAQTDEIMAELKQMYDYVIIDSPPVGVVSDTFLIAKYSDVTIYVVRQKFTHREAFSNNINQLKQKGVHPVSIVINDVEAKGMKYDYGYEYTYYSEEGKKSLLNKLKFRSSKKNNPPKH